MAITDGMRTHDEGAEKRYRMPDLLTKEEMRMYFAGTYGIDIEFKELSDDMKERVVGVGTLAITPPITDRDREFDLLREKLGIKELEERLGVVNDLVAAKELDSRVMTKEDFDKKYGVQTPTESKTPSDELDELIDK